MDTHGILTLYWTKPIEYLIAILYLASFVGFWRYVRRPHELALAPGAARSADWFTLAPGLRYHPGHTWARRDEDGLVSVGIDDFARKLIGPLDGVELPAIGTTLRQGESAMRLICGENGVGLLSPACGRVVAVNQDALQAPAVVNEDPYGAGWLLKIKPEQWRTDRRQLLSGSLARRWMEGVAEKLCAEIHPELGVALQDGGQAVNGIAGELHGERWSEFARAYLLS